MTSLPNPDNTAKFNIEVRRNNEIAWIILEGEADISTMEDLESALDLDDLRDVTSLHLHVKGLDFLDLTTVRRLTVFAKGARQSGHRIRTCGASPTFRLLARLLGVREDLGLL